MTVVSGVDRPAGSGAWWFRPSPGASNSATCAPGGAAKTKWGPGCGCPGWAHAPQQMKGMTKPIRRIYAGPNRRKKQIVNLECIFMGCVILRNE